MKPRFVLFGTYAEQNAGDDYMLAVQIEQFMSRVPGAQLVILTGDRTETRKFIEREELDSNSIILLYSGRHGIFEPGIPWYRSFNWFWQNLRETARADFLLIGPGNQLQDVTRRMRVLFFISRALLARITKTPYAYFGIGFYEIKSNFCRYALRWTARRAAFISTRDKGGAVKIRELGISESKIFGLRDITFCHNWDQSEPSRSQGKTDPMVGFSCRIFLPTVFPPKVANEFYRSLASLLAFIHLKLGAKLQFFPFYRSSPFHDGVALEKLKSRPELKEIPISTYQWDTLASLQQGISQCDGFVGIRYHSVLLSIQSGVPVLGLSYAHKTQRFMEETGLNDDVISVENVTAEKLIAQWQKLWQNRTVRVKQYRDICKVSQASANRHTDLILQHLSKNI